MTATPPDGRAPSLSDFLLARIAEDEAVARGATPGQWHADADYRTVTADPFTSARAAYDRSGDEDCWVIPESMDSSTGGHNLAHIARHDPVRVLAECEAKRRIVERHIELDMSERTYWLECLALPYADHEEYDERWKP